MEAQGMTTTQQLVREYNDVAIPEPGTYAIDPSHAAVEFVARHLMISKVRGGFTDVSGTITIADRPEDSSVEVSIATASINSGEAARDGHLRSADFFDVEQYPAITFRSTGVEHAGGERWKVTGDLTVRDVTRPVVLDVEFEGATATPFGDERIGFSASTEVNREDWGLTWNAALETGGVVVGKKVRLELAVEAIKQ
jgi:polyisoprenoid-binding protein YceI